MPRWSIWGAKTRAADLDLNLRSNDLISLISGEDLKIKNFWMRDLDLILLKKRKNPHLFGLKRQILAAEAMFIRKKSPKWF